MASAARATAHKAWSSQLDLIGRVIERAPLGIVTDIDGTIASIASHESEVAVSACARQALETIRERAALVAILTGRRVEDAVRLIDLHGIELLGNYGMERRRAASTEISAEAARYVPHIAAILSALAPLAVEFGVALYDKTLSATVNYRPCHPDRVAELSQRVEGMVAEAGLRSLRSRGSIEIGPPDPIHKGTALKAIVAEYRLSAVLYMGDDTADLDGFRAIRELRQQGLEALAIGVMSEEAPPEIADAADVILAGVHETDQLLEWIAARLPTGPRQPV